MAPHGCLVKAFELDSYTKGGDGIEEKGVVNLLGSDVLKSSPAFPLDEATPAPNKKGSFQYSAQRWKAQQKNSLEWLLE